MALRIAVASVPSRPSAVPPAVAILTFPWVICAASSRTPSASCRLWETRTRLTVAIGSRHDVDGMRRPRARTMFDLHPAGFAVRQHRIAAGRLDRLEESAADLHRKIVLFDLHAKGSRDPAASLIDFLEVHSRDQAQEARRGIADAVGFQVAGCVIEEAHRDRLEVDVELSGLMQHPQILANVVDAGPDLFGAVD